VKTILQGIDPAESTQHMSRPLKKPSFSLAKRSMAKAHLRCGEPERSPKRARDGAEEGARPSIADIIEEHRDRTAKIIRGKSSS
jgi:hypothetical protein